MLRSALFAILLTLTGLKAHASNDDYAYLRQDIEKMVAIAINNFPDRRGLAIEDDATHTVYRVSPPYDPFLTTYIEEQYITTDKESGHALLSKVYRDQNAKDIISAFTSFANSENKDTKDYTTHSALVQLPGGDFADTLRYKGIAVAVLYANGDKSFAVLTIGIIHNADRAAAAANLPKPYEKPWPTTKISDHLAVNGTTITVKAWGEDFDGNYDVAKIAAGDSCLSGDCSSGHGRKVLASFSATGQPRIRIMDGKFTHDIYTGDGVMLIDGEGPEVAGTYEISKLRINGKMNQYEAKCTFLPKGSKIPVKGLFYAPYSLNMYDPHPDYKHYTVCTFHPKTDEGEPESDWERDVDNPFQQYRRDAFKASPEGKAEEARRLANNAEFDMIKARNAATAKCTCCGGRGTIVNKSFNHVMRTGGNYMLYSEITCNCCHGTGHASDQTGYKANTNGGSHLDYKH